MAKLIFGSKRRYKYTKGQHTCHICKKGINKGLQLHHGKKKSEGGTSVKPVHDKCHKKSHKNFNHILTKEDRRKAGLKTYFMNLRNMQNHKPNIVRGTNVANITNKTQNTEVSSRIGQDGSKIQQGVASRSSS